MLAADAPKVDEFEPEMPDYSVDPTMKEVSVPQYEALLASCDGRPMLYLYVMLLAETGMRARS